MCHPPITETETGPSFRTAIATVGQPIRMSVRGGLTGTVMVMAFPTVATVTRTILVDIDSALRKKSRPKAALQVSSPRPARGQPGFLEAVANAQVVTGRIAVDGRHGTVQGLRCTAIVGHASDRNVQSRALGQVVNVAQSQLLAGRVAKGVDLVTRVGSA